MIMGAYQPKQPSAIDRNNVTKILKLVSTMMMGAYRLNTPYKSKLVQCQTCHYLSSQMPATKYPIYLVISTYK